MTAATVFVGSLLAVAAAQPTPPPAGVTLPSDAAVREILAERVEALSGRESGIGIVVGLIGPQGRRIISHGETGLGDSRPLDGDTGFEIGSVTKIFTALLLADMVRKGEVGLEDPVSKYLPAGINVPDRNGRPITLLDLATHTSGLPLMPDELPAIDDSAAENYSAGQLAEFLRRYELPSAPGAKWDYSNIGYWLLGMALATRSAMDFEEVLRTRVIAPLRLRSTAISLSPALKANLAVGHNAVLQPAPPFADVPGYSLMPAAGGLVSTANDLMIVLAEFMGYERTPLASSMSLMLETRRPAGGFDQAIGWMAIKADDRELYFHDGGSFGYASSVAWDAKSRIGVVVLSNQVTDVGDIARHLLHSDFPLAKPTATRRIEVSVDQAVLDAYVGRYHAEDEGPFVVALDGSFLTIQAPSSWGLPKLRLRAESPKEFFAAELPLRVSFRTDGGHVSEILVYPPRGQRAIPAKRIAP